jgi:hypothetical protein
MGARAAASTLALLALAGCAQLAALDMHKAAPIGGSRQQALEGILAGQTVYLLKSGTTEYLLQPVTASFNAMYTGERVVGFIRFENDKVVRRGVVGKAEEKKIRQVRPAFVLSEWENSQPISWCGGKPSLITSTLWGLTC